jgi:hypothetical protein
MTNCTECHQARAPELLDEHGYAPAAACR